MRIVRESSLLQQILNQHRADPISEVYLNKEEFNTLLTNARDRGVVDKLTTDFMGNIYTSFTIKVYKIRFIKSSSS